MKTYFYLVELKCGKEIIKVSGIIESSDSAGAIYEYVAKFVTDEAQANRRYVDHATVTALNLL